MPPSAFVEEVACGAVVRRVVLLPCLYSELTVADVAEDFESEFWIALVISALESAGLNTLVTALAIYRLNRSPWLCTQLLETLLRPPGK